ncbi:MAG: hypothetical protein EXR62_01805 [Chloroflexi bacterium]|nr:hypothetical protein [Chloroflexota bacterium]
MCYNATSTPANLPGFEPARLAESLAAQAAERAGIAVRRLCTWEELEQARMLQVTIWQMPTDLDAIAPRMLITFQKNGGLILGAYVLTQGRESLQLRAGTLVGVYIGFLGFLQTSGAKAESAAVFQVAHRFGVLATVRNRGVGRSIMLHARSLALSQGVRQMRWSFNSQNASCAHLSLQCLGAKPLYDVGETESGQVTVAWDLLSSSNRT